MANLIMLTMMAADLMTPTESIIHIEHIRYPGKKTESDDVAKTRSNWGGDVVRVAVATSERFEDVNVFQCLGVSCEKKMF